ncbi:MAG TPA: hypothetical protein VEC57_14565 [Candidatus Limnocylindrales bacterium]|nr:hypothetical protein [Candidatus Limnocylindrales bacterium]
MLHPAIKKGSTDRSVYLRIVDSTDGTPETGVVFNTSGVDLWYRRDGAAKVSITEATLSALTDAHSDGGFLHVGDGYYRLDLPDAAFATGSNSVLVGGTVTGMVVLGALVPLVDYDPQDTVRLGLTALPNAAAAASGGLPTVDSANDVGIQTGLKKNQAWNNFTFLMVDNTTEVPATGLTVTATRSIDGGAFGAGTLGAVSEIGSGYYKLNIPQADLNGDTVTLVFSATGAKTHGVTLRLEP